MNVVSEDEMGRKAPTYVQLVQLGPHTTQLESIFACNARKKDLADGINDAILVRIEVNREARSI